MPPIGIDFMAFWAKIHKGEGYDAGYHPLLCHMVDVAMVAHAMWTDILPQASKERISQSLGCGPDDTGRHIAFWAGLHDIGKASPAFQLQDEAARTYLRAAGLPCPDTDRLDHGTSTACILNSMLAGTFGYSSELALQVAFIAGAHHGAIPSSNRICSAPERSVGKGAWIPARVDLACMLHGATGVPNQPSAGLLDSPTGFFVAGLISVADWIGSSEDYFPFAEFKTRCIENVDAWTYPATAAERAHHALDSLGWTQWQPSHTSISFRALFDFEPRPLQQAVVELASRISSPALVIVESPMGEGKTEAAMYLSDRAIAGGERGSYFALPTMATSNQMFDRVCKFLAKRYPEDIVNVQLLHGHAALSAEFQELRRRGNRLLQPAGVDDERSDSASDADVIAAEWFTYRKRGLLAPFGVGTVDQALLAALQVRHVFVRLFGLSHKTVIIDEVHAYDTYMSSLLERLLEWLAAIGSPVILLSATLPSNRRSALAKAYKKGLGVKTSDSDDSACYPRLTWVSERSSGSTHVPASSSSSRRLGINWVDCSLPEASGDEFELGRMLAESLSEGGCAAVICNTVAQAQRVYQALKPYFPGKAADGWPELGLLHARYPFADRQRRERQALKRFGRVDSSDVKRPSRAVLVSTQIIEQSLDLDFDLMVSEMAPADLLLQRSGRLQRHSQTLRPERLGTPTLWIIKPDVDDCGTPDFGRATSRVYQPYVLLKSWLKLNPLNHITIPDDIEDIIESVYGDIALPGQFEPNIMATLESARSRYEQAVTNDRQQAKQRWLGEPLANAELEMIMRDPRQEDEPELHPELQALTRLTNPTVDVVFLYGSEQSPTLDKPGKKPVDMSEPPNMYLTKRLLSRAVSISSWGVVPELLFNSKPPAAWRKSPLLRRHRLLILDNDYSVVVAGYRVCLDRDLGLTITKMEKEVG
jgi:CRISPR-associated endonuclease/helicase Cas3